MLGEEKNGDARFNRRKLAAIGVIIILTMIQGNLLSLNPVTIVHGNTPAATIRNDTYMTKMIPVDPLGTIQWQQTYRNSSAYSVIQTTDGGYALAGVTLMGEGGQDIWVVKTDYRGIVEWQQIYGSSKSDRANAIIEAADGGFVVVGQIYLYDSEVGGWDWRTLLVKTDAEGNEQWRKYFTFGFWPKAHSVIQTTDGGYVLAGETEHPDNDNYRDFWLVKIDIKKKVEWHKTYGGSRADVARSVIQTTDGGYALVGETESHGAGLADAWLVKTDAHGKKEWKQTYGGSGYDGASSIIEIVNEGYVIVGYTESYGAGGQDFWLVKTDVNGTVEWTQTYGGSSDDYTYSGIQTADGGYALAGYTISFGSGGRDFWLVKTKNNGTVEWTQTYGSSEFDIAYSIIETMDGGFALAGATWSFGAAGADAWLVKTVSSDIDTDRDRLSDKEEIAVFFTDPLAADTDGDKLDDGEEVFKYYTKPTVADTDGDGLGDGAEVRQYKTDPLLSDAATDTDGDELTNVEEVDKYGTYPLAIDTDGDGLSDGEEILVFKTNPLAPDTDKDTYLDGEEVVAGTDPTDQSDHPTPKTSTSGVSDMDTSTPSFSIPGFGAVELVLAIVWLYLINRMKKITKR